MYIFYPSRKSTAICNKKSYLLNLDTNAYFLTDLSKKIDFPACRPSKEIAMNYPDF